MVAMMSMLAACPAQASGNSVPDTANGQTAVAPHLAANTNAPCNTAPKPGHVRCFAVVRTPASHSIAAAADAGGPPTTALSPSDIQSAYHLPAAGTGTGQTVAIVDAFGDSGAESDLAAFRSYYGLPACTTANGCFRKVDQTGGTSYPANDPDWGLETSLDLDAVSSACPACHILLVEGNSDSVPDLSAAENEAVALGAKFISNSYGTNEDPSLLAGDSAYNHPGVAVTASSGDAGNAVFWPSSDPDVTAVGGTLLTKDASAARGWDESAWDSGGSGCSTIEPQPSYQQNITTDCPMRATADISADADPSSGLATYDTLGYGGWLQVGGTSLASPLIASIYALAGTPQPGTFPVTGLYHDPNPAKDLNDITTGANGGCGNLLCQAGPGWDGPTGLGTPDGTGAFASGPQGQITGKVTDAGTGQPVAGVTVTASPGNYSTTTDSSGDYTLNLAAGTYTVGASMYAYNSGSDSGVQVPENGSATENFALTAQPHATVSGTVTDGSGHGWPLYAQITIGGGYPGGPVYTDPVTGHYSVVLAGPGTYPVQITSAEPSVTGAPDGGYSEQDAQLSVGTTAMSKDFSLTVDQTPCTAPGYGPAGLSEDFSGWTGTTPGAGWTVTGTNAGWRFDNPGSRPAPGMVPSSDHFAIADSGASGGRVDSTLTSPAVSLSGQSAPVLNFTSGYYGGFGQQASVDLSANNGKTWTTVWSHSDGDAVGPVSIPLKQAAGRSSVRVRFRYSGRDAWWWAVGDVLVGTPGCSALPGGLVTGAVTDQGTGQPVSGATVTTAAGGTAIAAGTSDPAQPGGLYQVFSPAGSQHLTAAAAGYASASASVDVTADHVTRHDWALTAASSSASHGAAQRGTTRRAVTVAARPGSAGHPATTRSAAAPALKSLSLPGLRAKSYLITLITGDQVKLTATGHGLYSIGTVPAARGGAGLQVSGVSGKKGVSWLQAMPDTAASLITSGRLDRGLFDLAWLIRHGDTSGGARLPVVLQYAGHPDAATLTHDAAALPGARVTSVSAAGGTARVSVAAGHAVAFWAAITARQAPRPGMVGASLASGISRVWLAGHRTGPAAQPAADGQRLYTVIENIQGSSDKSLWCDAQDALCLDDSFSLFGVSGAGQDQSYPATTISCAASTSPCTSYQVTYTVPVGTYMSSGYASFYQGPDLQELDMTVPQVTVAGNTSFSVNVNTEQKVTVSTPRPSFPVAAADQDWRVAPDGTADFNLTIMYYGYQYLWVVPSAPVSVGAFDFSSSWIRYAATVSMSVVSPHPLNLHPVYPYFTTFSLTPYASFTGGTLQVVNAGIGSAQDFSGIDARGKLALIKLDPVAGGCLVESSQLQNALQAGAAGVLVDPRIPGSVPSVTGECSLPIFPSWFYQIGPYVNEPFAMVPGSEAAALESRLASGTVQIHVTTQAVSPYQYDLKFYSEGQMPSSTAYTMTDRTLEAIRTSYHSDQAALAEPNDTAFAPDENFVADIYDGLSAPGAQTEYYGPVSPAVVWYRSPALVAGDTTGVQPSTTSLFSQPGGRLSEDWFDSPATLGSVTVPQEVFQAQPGKFAGSVANLAGCAACRQGDTFYPLFYRVSGASPQVIDGPYFYPDPPAEGIHLYHDGQEIAPVNVGGTVAYQLPAAKASYELTADDGGIHTDWQFGSAEPAASTVPTGYGCAGTFFTGTTAPCAPDPLIFLRYNAFTALANTVTAGATHQIAVTPAYQAAPAPAKITSLKLWISTDSGKTWQSEQVQSKDGTYTASYRVPALGATSGSVSVRVQAADSAGDSVTQTMTDAYPITG